MNDWRRAFPDDSRVTWERRLAAEAGPDAWAVAQRFATAWRVDNAHPRARALESWLARRLGIELVEFRSWPSEMSTLRTNAIDAAIDATRRVLRAGGIEQLRLYRGQHDPDGDVRIGEPVETVGRALTAWSPAREIAIGHAGRRRPAVVLRADVEVRQVAFAFDPSSDGEVVLLGLVPATVDTLVR